MKQAILTIAIALAGVSSAAAQDSFEKVLDEMLPVFGQLNESLATIKDKKTFADAKPKLEAVAKEMLALKERGVKLGEPKGKQKEELEAKYKAKLEDAARKLTTEMIRIKALTDGEEMVKSISLMLSPLSKK